MTRLNPYLSFRGNARTAMEFYQSVLGGELTINTFASYGGMGLPAAEHGNVMHAQLETADGLTLMGSDTPSTMPYTAPAGVSVSIDGTDEALLQKYWDGLAEGGTVTMPFAAPPWGGRFGMLTDRFGVAWMLSLNAQ